MCEKVKAMIIFLGTRMRGGFQTDPPDIYSATTPVASIHHHHHYCHCRHSQLLFLKKNHICPILPSLASESKLFLFQVFFTLYFISCLYGIYSQAYNTHMSELNNIYHHHATQRKSVCYEAFFRMVFFVFFSDKAISGQNNNVT